MSGGSRDEENWNILWQKYNDTGRFPLLDLVEASMPMLDGLKQQEIERMTKGFWNSRLKIGSNEHWITGIEAIYRRRKDNLERADRILRAAPEAISRFQRGELSFEQARSELKQKMGEGLSTTSMLSAPSLQGELPATSGRGRIRHEPSHYTDLFGSACDSNPSLQ